MAPTSGLKNCLLCLEFAFPIGRTGPFFSPRWLVLSCHLLSEPSLPSQVHLHPLYLFLALFFSVTLTHLLMMFLFHLFCLSVLKYNLHMSVDYCFVNCCMCTKHRIRPPRICQMNGSYLTAYKACDTHYHSIITTSCMMKRAASIPHLPDEETESSRDQVTSSRSCIL